MGEIPDLTAEAEMAQGLFPGSALGWLLSEPRLSRGEQPGNCAGVGIPAPARAQGHPARLWLLVSHLVPFPRLWSLSLQDGTYPGNLGEIKPPSQGEGRPQETLIYLLAELRL